MPGALLPRGSAAALPACSAPHGTHFAPSPPLADVLALKLGKTIVPVRHEAFVFPDVQKLPEDIQPIFAHNAMQWVGALRLACTDMLLGRLGVAAKNAVKR